MNEPTRPSVVRRAEEIGPEEGAFVCMVSNGNDAIELGE